MTEDELMIAELHRLAYVRLCMLSTAKIEREAVIQLCHHYQQSTSLLAGTIAENISRLLTPSYTDSLREHIDAGWAPLASLPSGSPEPTEIVAQSNELAMLIIDQLPDSADIEWEHLMAAGRAIVEASWSPRDAGVRDDTSEEEAGD